MHIPRIDFTEVEIYLKRMSLLCDEQGYYNIRRICKAESIY